MTDAIQKAREALEAAHRDEIERLTSPFYIRWTSGPDYETAFLCVEDGEPDMNAFAEVSFGQARLFKAALAALGAETPATPADVGEEPVAWQWRCRTVERDRSRGPWEPWREGRKPEFRGGTYEAEERPLYSATALERVVRERDNLQARLTARAKSMLRLREALAGVHDNIEDEGDRTYFGSTNDADTFREVWQDLDAWAWDDIMSDGKMTDVYAASREAHNRAESAEAKLAEARKVIEPFARVGDRYYSGYFDIEFAYPTLRVGDVRAARRFLEETK